MELQGELFLSRRPAGGRRLLPVGETDGPHRQGEPPYLDAGGLGFLLGDGRLRYGPETILETYYQARFFKSLFVAFDYQFVTNPGYNRDRGPVSIFGLKVHVEF